MSLESFLRLALFLGTLSLGFYRSGVSASWTVLVVSILIWAFRNQGWALWRWKCWRDPLIGAAGLYFLYMTLTLLWTDNLETGFAHLKNLGHIALMPVVIYIMKESDYLPVVGAFFTGMAVHMTFSYLTWAGVIEPFYESSADLSIFMNRLDYVILLTVTFLAGGNLAWRLRREKPKYAIALSLLAVFALHIIFLMEARIGHLIAIVVAPLNIALLMNRKNRLQLGLSATVFIFIGLSLSYYFSPAVRSRLALSQSSIERLFDAEDNERYVTSLGQRALALKIGYEIFLENPIFGVGAGDNVQELRKKLQRYRANEKIPMQDIVIHKTHFHNQYMETLTQGGLIGLILLFFIFVRFLSVNYREPVYFHLSLLLVITYAIGFIAEPYMQKQLACGLLFLAMPLLYRQGEPKKLFSR